MVATGGVASGGPAGGVASEHRVEPTNATSGEREVFLTGQRWAGTAARGACGWSSLKASTKRTAGVALGSECGGWRSDESQAREGERMAPISDAMVPPSISLG